MTSVPASLAMAAHRCSRAWAVCRCPPRRPGGRVGGGPGDVTSRGTPAAVRMRPPAAVAARAAASVAELHWRPIAGRARRWLPGCAGIGRRSPRPSCQAGVAVVAGDDRFEVVASSPARPYPAQVRRTVGNFGTYNPRDYSAYGHGGGCGPSWRISTGIRRMPRSRTIDQRCRPSSR